MTPANIIFIGPPGAGKGTQAQRVCQAFGWHHVSTGDILRAEIKAASPLGKKAQAFVDKGELVPDALVNDMLSAYLRQHQKSGGFVFDGYPRNATQAQKLDEILASLKQAVDLAVEFEVPEEILLDRIKMRVASSAVTRSDDKAEILKSRIDVYRRDLKGLAGHYAALGKLKRVNGHQLPDQVFTRLNSFLQAYSR